jgi:hypothetical protein
MATTASKIPMVVAIFASVIKLSIAAHSFVVSSSAFVLLRELIVSHGRRILHINRFVRLENIQNPSWALFAETRTRHRPGILFTVL